VPFSQVYVCDFELDFISKDDTQVLLRPMQQLRERNAGLQSEFDELVGTLEKTQQSEEQA